MRHNFPIPPNVSILPSVLCSLISPFFPIPLFFLITLAFHIIIIWFFIFSSIVHTRAYYFRLKRVSPSQLIEYVRFSYSNYGPTIFAQQIAQQKGCSQCLWLYNDEVSCSFPIPLKLCIIPKMKNMYFRTFLVTSRMNCLHISRFSSFSSGSCNSRSMAVSFRTA